MSQIQVLHSEKNTSSKFLFLHIFRRRGHRGRVINDDIRSKSISKLLKPQPSPSMSSWFMPLAADRKRQMMDEEKLDARLQRECTKCPEQVQTYLFNMRKLNRIQSAHLYDAPFYSFSSIVKLNMAKIDTIQHQLLDGSNTPPSTSTASLPLPIMTLCQKLDEINKTLDKLIDE